MKSILNTRRLRGLSLIFVGLTLAGCAMLRGGPSDVEIAALLKASFSERGPAKLERLEQNALQRACSLPAGQELDKAVREKLQQEALAAVQFPADGRYLGSWQEGERIAQNGRGLQFSDPPNVPNGANCYACHQIQAAELSFGNIGPSLLQYGKMRGTSEPILKYTWTKIYNSHAYNACSQMPRYGDAGILTTDQIRHVMALLLDPASPVNR